MAKCIVEVLEVIQVHHDDAHGLATSLRATQLPFKHLIQVASVESAGQRVSNGLTLEHFSQPYVGDGQPDLLSEAVGQHQLVLGPISPAIDSFEMQNANRLSLGKDWDAEIRVVRFGYVPA